MSYDEQSALLQEPYEAAGKDPEHQYASVRDPNQADALPNQPGPGRTIGWISAYMLILSRVIGSGIFAMPGTILQNVGSPALAFVLWIAGALIAWCALSIDLEFGCMLPRSGGIKVYLEHSYPKPRFLASTMIAVHVVLLGFTASNCIVFAKYVLFASDVPATDLPVKLLAVGLMTAITILHGCFRRTGIFVQNVLGWLKIALVNFIILTGIAVTFSRALHSSPQPQEPRKTTSIWDGADWGYNTLATALFKVFYAYAGLDNLNNVLSEVKNPVKILKTIPPVALLSACLFYLLVNFAYMSVIPLEEIKESQELVAALFFERVFGPSFGKQFLPLSIALSAAGNVMVVTFSLARINQEVARQGFLPFRSLLASSKPFDSPFGGLLVHWLPSVIVISAPPSSSVYAFIAEIEVYAGQFFALAVAAGLLILRRRQPELLRPYKAWTPGVVLRIVLCLVLIAAPLFPPKDDGKAGKRKIFYATYALVALSILIFGVLYWYIWTRLLPRLGGYRLEEEIEVLDDGTKVTKLVRRTK